MMRPRAADGRQTQMQARREAGRQRVQTVVRPGTRPAGLKTGVVGEQGGQARRQLSQADRQTVLADGLDRGPDEAVALAVVDERARVEAGAQRPDKGDALAHPLPTREGGRAGGRRRADGRGLGAGDTKRHKEGKEMKLKSRFKIQLGAGIHREGGAAGAAALSAVGKRGRSATRGAGIYPGPGAGSAISHKLPDRLPDGDDKTETRGWLLPASAFTSRHLGHRSRPKGVASDAISVLQPRGEERKGHEDRAAGVASQHSHKRRRAAGRRRNFFLLQHALSPHLPSWPQRPSPTAKQTGASSQAWSGPVDIRRREVR